MVDFLGGLNWPPPRLPFAPKQKKRLRMKGAPLPLLVLAWTSWAALEVMASAGGPWLGRVRPTGENDPGPYDAEGREVLDALLRRTSLVWVTGDPGKLRGIAKFVGLDKAWKGGVVFLDAERPTESAFRVMKEWKDGCRDEDFLEQFSDAARKRLDA